MYLVWEEKTIEDFGEENIERMYARGFLFTRKGKGVMQETRSLRIDLSKFALSSENRRVMKKTSSLQLTVHDLASGNFEYKWGMGKLAKDFYERFGEKTFSANKAKELLTIPSKSNFNTLFDFGTGYAICYESKNTLHYAYPFYSLSVPSAKDQGLGMMTRAIGWAKESGKKYIYLGSASRENDTYKLQFIGLEWWNKGKWSDNMEELKSILGGE